MKRKYLLFIYLFISMSIKADDRHINPLQIEADISLFEIGKDISYLDIDYKHPRIMINSSSFSPFFIVISDNFSYKVAFKDNKVIAVFVGEPVFILSRELFKTPEGVYKGMSYREVLEIYPEIRLRKLIGWAYVGVLPSGWKIGFVTGYDATEWFPNFEDHVAVIFKD
jgi:hypothetical protein